MKDKKVSAGFPADFLWGASTSGHQVEGGLNDQWTRWEKHTANTSARNASDRYKYYQSWPTIRSQASNPHNYIAGSGIAHEKLYKQDFRLLKKLNLNSFRFSIEWSKVEPKQGQWDKEAIQYYKQYIHELRLLGIEPIANLWHWTNPVWFEDMGAFTKRSNLKYFERFVRKVANEILDEVTYVVTINEANNYSLFGYFAGYWPPGKRNALLGVITTFNLMRAHKMSYALLKAKNPLFCVGIAHNVAANVPKSPHNVLHVIIAHLADYFWDTWFYRRVRKHQDFIGVNYYMTNYITAKGARNPLAPRSDLNWYMEPSAIGIVARRLWYKFKKPIIITENGVADGQDQYRKWWIEETINALADARKEGVDVAGYLHWSLLDNFEWAEGYWPKFGLIAVDRENGMKRSMRPSAKWLASYLDSLQSKKT